MLGTLLIAAILLTHATSFHLLLINIQYVWMTGFGNFLYFDKKQDFSMDRMICMWIRINYFPILLSVFLSVPLGTLLRRSTSYGGILHHHGHMLYFSLTTRIYQTRVLGRATVLPLRLRFVVHVVFYETPCVNFLKLFSDEYYFRFQADKYSAWVGMCSWIALVQVETIHAVGLCRRIDTSGMHVATTICWICTLVSVVVCLWMDDRQVHVQSIASLHLLDARGWISNVAKFVQVPDGIAFDRIGILWTNHARDVRLAVSPIHVSKCTAYSNRHSQ